jgi:7-cyano-7-deazaguanine reductase
VTFHCAEFTCLCPITGQPDFGELEISYVPGQRVLESKSLKLYLWTYRDVGTFHEDVVNELLDALHDFLKPRWIKVTGRFNVRGGIAIDVTAERDGTSGV